MISWIVDSATNYVQRLGSVLPMRNMVVAQNELWRTRGEAQLRWSNIAATWRWCMALLACLVRLQAGRSSQTEKSLLLK